MNTKPKVLHLTNRQKENLPLWIEEIKKLQKAWKENINQNFGLKIVIDPSIAQEYAKTGDGVEVIIEELAWYLEICPGLTHPLFKIDIEGQYNETRRAMRIECVFATNGCTMTLYFEAFITAKKEMMHIWNDFIEKHGLEKFKEPFHEKFPAVEAFSMIQDWTRFILGNGLGKPTTL